MSPGRPQRPRPGPRRPFAWALAAVFIGLTIGNVHRTLGPPNPGHPADLASARALVYLTVQGIEEYRDSTGAFPPTLDAAGLDYPGLEYHPRAGGYSIATAAVGGSGGAVHFTLGDDLEPYRAAARAVIARGSGS